MPARLCGERHLSVTRCHHRQIRTSIATRRKITWQSMLARRTFLVTGGAIRFATDSTINLVQSSTGQKISSRTTRSGETSTVGLHSRMPVITSGRSAVQSRPEAAFCFSEETRIRATIEHREFLPRRRSLFAGQLPIRSDPECWT